jgi:tetratricopeptide (TPR) repeat protein
MRTPPGWLWVDLGHPDKARRAHDEAVQLAERAGEAGRSWLAAALVNVSIAARAQGDYTAANERLQRALGLFEALYGDGHPATARAVGNLAKLRLELGDGREALRLAERALATRRQLLGERHLDVGISHLYVAQAHALLEAWPEALAQVERARALFVETLGPEHPWTRSALTLSGVALARNGQAREGQARCAQAVAVAERGKPLQPLELFEAQLGLGRVLLAQGQDREAVARLRQALEAVGTRAGPLARASALTVLAGAQLRLGRGTAARASALEAVALYERAGAQGPELAQARAVVAAAK